MELAFLRGSGTLVVPDVLWVLDRLMFTGGRVRLRRITIFHGGSHLTLISHPDAVTAVIASAICSLR